jgi:hypothetical protein
MLRVGIDRTSLFSFRNLRTALVTAEIVILVTLNLVLDSPPPEIVYKGF